MRGGECGQRANYRIYCAAHSELQRRKDAEAAERGSGGAPRGAGTRRAPDLRRRERAPAADRARLAALQALQARAGPALDEGRGWGGRSSVGWSSGVGARGSAPPALQVQRAPPATGCWPRAVVGVSRRGRALLCMRALASASASPWVCERRVVHGADGRLSQYAATRPPPEKAAGVWCNALGFCKACAPRRRAAA